MRGRGRMRGRGKEEKRMRGREDERDEVIDRGEEGLSQIGCYEM